MKTILCALAGASLAVSVPAAAVAQTAADRQPQTAPATPTPAPASLGPVDPASLALAHQIITLAFPPAKRADMMSSMIDSLLDQARNSLQDDKLTQDKDFQALLDRSTQRMFDQMKASLNTALPDYFESMERAYARDFSRDDLTAILAFVKTPAGQRYFERAPQIVKDPDVQAVSRRMTSELLGKLPELQQELVRDVQDYISKKKEKKAAASVPVS